MYICIKLEDEYFIPLNILDICKDTYMISNYGTVKNRDGLKMKTFISNTGYSRIGLKRSNGKRKNYSIHRLVALVFVPNIDNCDIVNHKNGIKKENYYLNLEWCTQSENNIHALETGLSQLKGETHHFAKYSDDVLHSLCKEMENVSDPHQICTNIGLIDTNTPRSSKVYQRYRSYIKFLRSKTFRKDITQKYNI